MTGWWKRKSARLYLSLWAGILAMNFSENTVAWWGLLYPDFCQKVAEESDEESDKKPDEQPDRGLSEETGKVLKRKNAQPEYALWIVEFIKKL